MYRGQTLIPSLQHLRISIPIFIPGIKASLDRYYFMDLGVIHVNVCLKILSPMIKERGGDVGKRDWVQRRREEGLGG